MQPGESLWDAIVVGAGPAGCAAAYDLAAAGRQVLLLDRAAFPRRKACAGGLTLKAVRALRYPIDPVVRHWAREIVLEEAPGQAVSVGRRVPVCAMTVREELDSFCLKQTVARGAVFAKVARLEAVEQADGLVTLRFADGSLHRGRFVVGADGVHSQVRALAVPGSAGWLRSGFALECNVPYAAGEPPYPLTFDFAAVPGGYGWLFPRDNHVNVGLYREAREGGAPTLNRAALEQYVAARCGAGRRYSQPVGQFLGFGAAAYEPQRTTRVLLAGDAAGCVDPLTGEGIHGAIRSGQAAAEAIEAALAATRQAKPKRGTRQPNPHHPAVEPVVVAYRRAAARLRADLKVAEFAVTRFYPDPRRGFQLMRLPLVPHLVLRGYGEGLPLARLLAGLRVARRLLA